METSSQLPVTIPTRSHSLVEMPASVGRYAEAGLQGAANTQRGYAADLRSFADYCQHHQLSYLPAEVTTVARYVAELADRGLKLATIRRHVAAIPSITSWRLSLADHPRGPECAGRHHPGPGQAAAAGAGLHGSRTQGKHPQLDVTTTATACGTGPCCLLGFAGAFRRSELVALNVEDVELTSQALVIHLQRAKPTSTGRPKTKPSSTRRVRIIVPCGPCRSGLSVWVGAPAPCLLA